jgi:hypothetical protein
VDGDEKLPQPPLLPQRAAIYIAPDGTVHFGALFSDLLPVARALGGPMTNANQNETENENDIENEHQHEHESRPPCSEHS